MESFGIIHHFNEGGQIGLCTPSYKRKEKVAGKRRAIPCRPPKRHPLLQKEREGCWGPFTLSPRQRSPDPVRGASPPAPPLYVWMSELQPVDNQCHRAIYCTNTILPQSFV